jgi:hypothetical protein
MKSDLFQGVTSALIIPDTRPPTYWAEDNLYIEHSERRAGLYDRNYAPWLNEPVDCLADPKVFASSLCKPVQSGGTQGLEIHSAWALANVPGPAILTGQSDKDVEAIFRDKFLKTLKSSPGTKDILSSLPQDSVTKDRLDLPNMPWDIQGPSGNKIQSKTKRYLYNDEVWKYKPSVLQMLLKRTDAVTGRKVFSVSQAGEQISTTKSSEPIWDEWGSWWYSGTQELFSILCPTCGGRFFPETSHIEWDTTPETKDPQTKVYLWKNLKKTVRLKCPLCGAEHHPGNTIEERQAFVHKLASTGIYVPTNPNAREGHRSFRYSIWVVWWKDWGDMVEEYLHSREKLKVGVIDDYRLWVQQREARFWTIKDDEVPSFKERKMFGYKMEDFKRGEELEESVKRLMAVDMQSDCYKVVIRDFQQGGNSRLVFQGTLKDWGEIAHLQAQYRIKQFHTAVDAGNWTQAVYRECSERQWIALHGSSQRSWVHQDKTAKSQSNKPYSTARQGRVATAPRKAQGGRPPKPLACWYYEWNNLYFKDWLSRLAAGQGATWEYADDVDDEYIQSLDSEVRRMGQDGKPKWERIGYRPNHYWDCELMLLVLGSIIGGIFVDMPEATEQED